MSDPNKKRPGYKETKVGWIPNEWSVKALAEVSTIQTGLAKGKNIEGDSVSLPYLRVANVQDGHVTLDEVKMISVKRRDVDRYSLCPNDVLFTEGGDFDKLGRGCVWHGQIDPCLHQNHIFAVRCKSSKILPCLLACYASSIHGRRYFALNSKQSTNLASINSTQLKAFPVVLPPMQEQQKIAEILGNCDRVIEKTSALIDAKKRQKKALMQQLLTGKKRLPGFEGEWKSYRLGDLFTERAETNCEYLPLLAITGTRGIIPAADINRRDSSSADKSRYKAIYPGDIGYNTMRMWQGVSAVSRFKGIVSPAYTICVPTNRVDVVFMGYFFKCPPVVYLFWRFSQGLVDDTLNLKFPNFEVIRVTIPDKAEQRAIAKVLENADEVIALLETKQAALKQQKKALMQKLLTGQVRVKV